MARRRLTNDICTVRPARTECHDRAAFTVNVDGPDGDSEHRVCLRHVGHAIEACYTGHTAVQVVPDYAREGMTFRATPRPNDASE